MKIIHTADLHLDSSLQANLDPVKRKERRNELTLNFSRLCEDAVRVNAKAVLIAGDLFDKDSVTRKVGLAVLNEITKNENIDFYYLKGNHDRGSFEGFIKETGKFPENLHLFDTKWTKYEIEINDRKKLAISGAEFNENVNELMSTLKLNPDDINIVMLHGQESEYKGKDDAEIIPLGELKGKAIDYLALGHIHEYKLKQLDSRGTYCYPGCLEGRGFDEIGDHGYVLLDIDEETGDIIPSFIDFAYRKLHEINVDITGLENSAQAIDKAEEVITAHRYNERDYLKIILTGDIDENAEIDESLVAAAFKDDYYFVKAVNDSKVKVDYNKYLGDESLKGWFVRLVSESDEIDEDMKGEIVRMGLDALAGEEILK